MSYWTSLRLILNESLMTAKSARSQKQYGDNLQAHYKQCLKLSLFIHSNITNMQDAQDALAQLEDDENEEEDIEKVEDLLEFYLQRASATQNQAERVLAGARDLEESIGVSLSARRFEV